MLSVQGRAAIGARLVANTALGSTRELKRLRSGATTAELGSATTPGSGVRAGVKPCTGPPTPRRWAPVGGDDAAGQMRSGGISPPPKRLGGALTFDERCSRCKSGLSGKATTEVLPPVASTLRQICTYYSICYRRAHTQTAPLPTHTSACTPYARTFLVLLRKGDVCRRRPVLRGPCRVANGASSMRTCDYEESIEI